MTMRAGGGVTLTPNEVKPHGEQPTNDAQVNGVVRTTHPLGGLVASFECDTTITNAEGSNYQLLEDLAATDLVIHVFISAHAVPTSTTLPLHVIIIGHGSTGGPTNVFFTLLLKRNDAGTAELHYQRGGDTAAISTIYSEAYTPNTDIRLELRVAILNAARKVIGVEARRDETLLFSHVFSDVSFSNLSAVNAYRIGNDTGPTAIGVKLYAGVIVVQDTAGSVNNKWVGAVTMKELRPNGAGSNLNYTAFTDDYLSIDDAPTTSDYIVSGTVGHKEGWTLGTYTLAGETVRGLISVWDLQRAFGSAEIGFKVLTWDGAERATAEMFTEVSNEGAHASERKGFCIVMETLPGGGAINQTAIDNLEHGLEITSVPSGGAVRLHAQCDYLVLGNEGPALSAMAAPCERAVGRGAMRGLMRGMR